MPDCKRLLRASFLVAALICSVPLGAQSETPDDEAAVFELSPFEVNTSGDRGYYASNAISGSRIDVRIQDMPLTIEVVTSEFIEDTGSTDLRESLRYSAGILLQSQNDAFGGGFDNFGGVNNPEGATGDQSDTGFKIRGFVTDNTLRKGFRRRHSTDSINIDRVEVVRGPSALLYGVGNFGGVVNYLPKAPLPEFAAELGVGIGSDAWRRGTVDVTGPLPFGFGYRVTAAVEDSDDWTESRTHEHFFVSPVLRWKWAGTQVTVDFEYGEAEDRGVGFKSVRTPTLPGIPITQADRLETYGFLEFEGKDPRTFRWSGPDTYYLTESWNLNVELEQELIEDMYLLIGYNRSHVSFENRDIFGGIRVFDEEATIPPRAAPLLGTFEGIQIIDGQTSDVRIPVDNGVLQYAWTDGENSTDWDQARAEVNYRKRLFEESTWGSSEHSLILGYSYESQKGEYVNRQMDNPSAPAGTDQNYYKNPTDSDPIRFDSPVDGSEPATFGPLNFGGQVARNEGTYLVYNGRFLKDRLFLIGGLRRDVSSNLDGYQETFFSRRGETGFERRDKTTGTEDPATGEFLPDFPDSEVTKDTAQWGISYEVLDGLTVYALQSEGVEPNFDGQRDGNGVPLDSSVAESREVGVKFNLFDSKVSASFSFFKIERSGVPFSYWWAPAPATRRFDREADIIYNLDDPSGGQNWNLDAQIAAAASNPDREVNRYLLAAKAEWDAARASGAIFQAVNEASDLTHLYINASTPEGAAFLDRVFAELNAEFALPRNERTDADPFPGWLYHGSEYDQPDSNVNFATMDKSSTNGYFQTISDQSEGWEAQIILSPIDEFQIVFNYSTVERTVVSPGNFVSYPYAEGNWDRWASWYFPNANWGLAGAAPNVAYPGGAPGLPSEDTSTWAGVGWGQGESLDDTPKHVVSWWSSWTFREDSPLRGLQLGFGGQWESEREYASALTSAGQQKQNETGTTIKAFTDPRLTLNAMAKYSWTMGKEDEYEAFVQFNVDNFLDDTDQYGLIYAPGLSWRLQSGISF